MNQGEDSSQVNIAIAVKEMAKAYPQLIDEEQAQAIRQVLEKKSVDPVIEPESVSHRFATIAATLGGTAALGLLAAAAVPELPVVTLVAVASGFLVSRLAARKIDEVAKRSDEKQSLTEGKL